MGNENVTNVSTGGSITAAGVNYPSDGRFKSNIREDVKGLDFVLKLRPVTYNFNKQKLAAFTEGKLTPEALNSNSSQAAFDNTSVERKTGFIAQEVEQAAKQVNYDFDGIKKPENEKDIYALNYAEFVVPLVKAVQEQQAQMDKLTKENDTLKATIATMQTAFAAQQELVTQQLKQLQAAMAKQGAKEQPASVR